MDISQIKILADAVGWPAVVVMLLIVGAAGYFILSNIISSKDVLIAAKDERIAYLETRLQDAENYSPDMVVRRLTERYAILSKEVEDLSADKERNKELLREKQLELEVSRKEIQNLTDNLNSILESTQGLLCPYCKAPLETKEYHFISGEDSAGRYIDADIEVVTYKCGLSLEDGIEREKCGNKYRNLDE